MIFFTKTCARDVERVVYQMRAVRRLFPHVQHAFVVEATEINRIPQAALEGRTTVASVECWFEHAMEIVDPYMRQQYVKLMAPIVMCDDTLQLDSDMCPFTNKCPLLGAEILLSGGYSSVYSIPRWHFTPARKAIRSACTEWDATYGLAFGFQQTGKRLGVMTRKQVAPSHSFMLEQHGWYLRRDVATEFVKALETSMGLPLHEALQRLAKNGKLSEYQLFGQWAYNNRRDAYDWVENSAPPWCHHFSSTEPLEPWMHEKLEAAANG